MRACPSLACLILVACGGSSASTTPPDARTADAPPATVHGVTCPPGDMPTVMTTDIVDAFDPMATAISVHGIVKFAMSASHNVGPDPSLPSDPVMQNAPSILTAWVAPN